MNHIFCNLSGEDKNNLINIFKTSFDIPNDGIDALFEKYTAFKKEFDSNEEPSLGYITLQRDWVLPKTTDSEFLSKYKNENEYNIGIDLPILLEPQIPNGKSIMFIAEDPLRDNIPKICQDVVLSTTFWCSH